MNRQVSLQLPLQPEEKELLKRLPEEVLPSILECKRLKHLEALLNEKIASEEERDALLALAKKRAQHVKSSSNKITESFLDLLTPMSYLFLISDTVFTLVTAIALLTFALAAAGFFALVAVVGFIYFMGIYKELKQKDEKTDKHFQLLAFKNDCADLIMENKNLVLKADKPSENVVEKIDNKIWQKLKNSLGTTVLVGGTLFYTYYAITLALTIAFAGSATVGVLTGPIGIGVVLALAIIVGIYFGYKRYQLDKKNQQLKSARNKMEGDFDDKYRLCTLNNAPRNNFKPEPQPGAGNPSGPGPVLFKKTGAEPASSFSSNNPHHLYSNRSVQLEKVQGDKSESEDAAVEAPKKSSIKSRVD